MSDAFQLPPRFCRKDPWDSAPGPLCLGNDVFGAGSPMLGKRCFRFERCPIGFRRVGVGSYGARKRVALLGHHCRPTSFLEECPLGFPWSVDLKGSLGSADSVTISLGARPMCATGWAGGGNQIATPRPASEARAGRKK